MKQNEKQKRCSIREYKAAAWAVTKAQFPSVWQIFLCFVLIGLPFSYASLISQVPVWDKHTMTLIELAVLCVRNTFLTGALSIGGMVAVIRMVLAQPVSLRTIFVGFRQRYGKIVWLNLSQILVIMGWSFLFIIPGVIKLYSYAMAGMIFVENPHMTPREARRESARMMKGHKWAYFLLELSFIGWSILSIVTFRLSDIWCTPYRAAAVVYFYQSIKDHQSPKGNLTTDEWK